MSKNSPKIALSQKSNSKAKTQFLRLHFSSATIALLSTEKVVQVLTIDTNSVVSMPHMAPWIIGAYNHRGEIHWIVDLGCLIGLKSVSQQAGSLSNYTTIVLQIGSENCAHQLLGLVVDQVNSTERCEMSSIKALSAAPTTEFEKFLTGYWQKSATDEILAVLDPDRIWQKIVDYPIGDRP